MSASLIDTHAHLDDERFRGDLPEVLERAASAGLGHIVAVATTGATARRCTELAEDYPSVFATAGVHPNNAADEDASAWDHVVSLATHRRVVALGETGLDRHWDDTPFAMQQEYFARHLELARKVQKPVVIHCREAEADVLGMLRDDFDRHGAIRGVMHSFAADLPTAQACLEMGLFISFAGMLTFKNAQSLRDVAARVPLDRLLVETDSPFLSPVPLRGKRNEPAHVIHTATCLAQVKGATLDTIAEQTTRNAELLFHFT